MNLIKLIVVLIVLIAIDDAINAFILFKSYSSKLHSLQKHILKYLVVICFCCIRATFFPYETLAAVPTSV